MEDFWGLWRRAVLCRVYCMARRLIGRNVRGDSRLDGFALRDLLATISVMVLLGAVSSLWCEAFAKKRNAMRCLTNGRQMMQAFGLYAQDHDGLLAPNEDNTVLNYSWFASAAGRPAETNQLLAADSKINLLAPYASDHRIWKCPEDPAFITFLGKRVRTVRSVSMNGAVGTVSALSPAAYSGAPVMKTHGPWLDGVHGHVRDTKFRTFGKENQFVRPAATIVFIEEHPPSLNDGVFGTPGYDPQNPALSAVRWVDYPAIYHGRAGGVTFADGHAEIHRWNSLRYPAVGLPTGSVTPEQRKDWEWLGTHVTQALR